VITRSDYFKLHGEPQGLTRDLLLANADLVLSRWNRLLQFAAADGVSPTISLESGTFVASGYRPAGVNAATKNAAAASSHLTCEAMDVGDARPDRPLAFWICTHLNVAEEIGLWFEDFRWTWRNSDNTPTVPGALPNGHPWCHGQTKPPSSGHRIYIPAVTAATDPDFFKRHSLPTP
jgi:hypothetical protein